MRFHSRTIIRIDSKLVDSSPLNIAIITLSITITYTVNLQPAVRSGP